MKSIIVVDDDKNIRQTVLDILSFEDLSGEPFSSAEGVLERLAQGDVGLVITDLNMPGKDGIELISDIRTSQSESFRDVPIILLTGAGYESRSAEALSKGATLCLGKPFDIGDFLDNVFAALGRKPSA